jgi:hypothetical protein
LVHLNSSSILQIAIFVHLCKVFLRIPPNFPLFKNYFFLRYLPSVANRKVVGGVGLGTCPHADFLNLPLKTSLRRWHGTWFYCENDEPSPPSLCGPTPGIQRYLERRANSTQASLSCCPSQQGQHHEGKRLNRGMHGCPLAGPLSRTVEETSPSRLGIQRSPRPNSGVPGKHNSRALSEASTITILGHRQLADR